MEKDIFVHALAPACKSRICTYAYAVEFNSCVVSGTTAQHGHDDGALVVRASGAPRHTSQPVERAACIGLAFKCNIDAWARSDVCVARAPQRRLALGQVRLIVRVR